MGQTELELDHETHTYMVSGKPIGGVSEILCSLGLVDRSYFTDWARERGTAVHAAIEYHLTGALDWKSLDPRIEGYVRAALQFLQDARITAGPGTHVERPVWHPALRYAGMPDLVGVAFGAECVIDWKSGAIGMAGLATAAYEQAARIAFPVEKPRRRMAVQLFEDGRYKKTDLQDGYDYAYWQSATGLFNAFILPKKQRGAIRAIA